MARQAAVLVLIRVTCLKLRHPGIRAPVRPQLRKEAPNARTLPSTLPRSHPPVVVRHPLLFAREQRLVHTLPTLLRLALSSPSLTLSLLTPVISLTF